MDLMVEPTPARHDMRHDMKCEPGLAALHTLGDETGLGGAGKRLAVAADRTVCAALFHEAGFGGAGQRLTVGADGLGCTGLRHRRTNSKRCDQNRKRKTFHHFLLFGDRNTVFPE
jgi:hypothetical protein